MSNSTLTAPKGFRVAAVKAGIKASGNPDLGLIVADQPCTAAAVFTTNRVQSPAVRLSREHVRNGRAQAVFVNAGNANTCTGKQGARDTLEIATRVAGGLDLAVKDVLVCSTGIIGHFLPMENVRGGIDAALKKLTASAAMGGRLAKAIMTTDTKPKSAVRRVKLGGKTVTLAGIVKGAGMIDPNMATMLAFITTDAAIRVPLLRRALKDAVNLTFNKLSIDKHRSTSDTASVLASGLARNKTIAQSGAAYRVFADALWSLCDDLARQMAADAEGATCTVKVIVTGAATKADANRAVRTIVDSPLVRSAFHGADPNWGRIVSAVGFSGARFREEKLTCKIAGTAVYRNGRPVRFDARALSKKMKDKSWIVELDLGVGKHEDFCYTCDLSEEYVTINADYHT